MTQTSFLCLMEKFKLNVCVSHITECIHTHLFTYTVLHLQLLTRSLKHALLSSFRLFGALHFLFTNQNSSLECQWNHHEAYLWTSQTILTRETTVTGSSLNGKHKIRFKLYLNSNIPIPQWALKVLPNEYTPIHHRVSNNSKLGVGKPWHCDILWYI